MDVANLIPNFLSILDQLCTVTDLSLVIKISEKLAGFPVYGLAEKVTVLE